MIDDDKKFNILYLHNESIMGGAEISLLNLVKRLDKQLFTPHFACSKEGPFIDELRNIKISPDFVQFPSIRWPNPVRICNTIRNLTNIIKKKQIDLIHSNQPRSNLFVFYDVCKIPDGIADPHGVWPSYTWEFDKVRRDFYVSQLIYKRPFLGAGKVGRKKFPI